MMKKFELNDKFRAHAKNIIKIRNRPDSYEIGEIVAV